MINYNDVVGGGIASLMPGSDTTTPGAFDFAQKSEPVLRMARGGIARFAFGGTTQDIVDAYNQEVVGGGMSEADFVSKAMSPEFGVSAEQLGAARDVLLGGAPAATTAAPTNFVDTTAGIANQAATTQAAPTGMAGLQDWYAQNQTANPNAIAYQMQQFGVTPQQVATQYGLDPAAVEKNYQAALPYANLYGTYLKGDTAATNAAIAKSGLTADQIAAGFNQDAAHMAGLRAAGFNVGATTPEIQQAFLTGGTGTPDLASLNKGFEWAQANKLSDDALIKALGKDTYDKYATQYGQGIKSNIDSILADKTITNKEALDFVSAANKYGIGLDDITKYAKINPDVAKGIFNTYDTTIKGIVSNVLNPDSTLSTAQKVGGILSLQQQYGLTDADIAKYSGGKVKTEEVTNFLDPIKNFATDFQKIAGDPNAKAADIAAFYDKAKADTAISALYGDKLKALEPQMAEIKRLADVGTIANNDRSYDAYSLARLAGQLGSSFDKSVSSGGAFNTKGEQIGFKADEAAKIFGDKTSGATQVMLDMAAQLQDMGIRDLKQVGVRTVEVPQMAQVSTGGEGAYELVPTGKMEQKQEFFDKNTGKALDVLNDMGGRFGETYTGKGATDYYLKADDQGNVQAYTKGRDTSDAGAIAPLLAIAGSFAVPWLSSAISGLLPGAAAAGTAATGLNTLASNALASGLFRGGVGALAGQDVGKSFLTGAINPLVSAGIGSLINAGMGTVLPSDLSVGTQNLLKTAGTSLLSGQKPEDILTNMGFGYGMNQLFGPNAGIVAPLVTSLAKTGTINPNTLFNTAMQLGRTAKP